MHLLLMISRMDRDLFNERLQSSGSNLKLFGVVIKLDARLGRTYVVTLLIGSSSFYKWISWENSFIIYLNSITVFRKIICNKSAIKRDDLSDKFK